MTLPAMGRDLRARRRSLGLTQAGLAQAVGTRPVMVGRWERGEALPSLDEAVRLAEVLDLDPAVAAGWSAVALRPAPEAVPSRAPAPALPGGESALPAWRRRLAVLPAMWLGRWRPSGRVPGEAGDEAVFPAPRARRPGESYLDDPVERRRYALRFALTLIALGALAIGLVWAVGQLGDGWGAFLDLFRGRPPASGVTRALSALLAV